jgi:hypothetical protein
VDDPADFEGVASAAACRLSTTDRERDKTSANPTGMVAVFRVALRIAHLLVYVVTL